jgi:SPX domain protein involved in polyphosphate accumulation
MKFKKYQTMFALGTPWQDDVVNYAELKKLIYSHVVIPAADSPPSPSRNRSSSKFITSRTFKAGGGGGILAELDEMNDESEDEMQDNIRMPHIVECEAQLRVMLEDNLTKCNIKWDEMVGKAQQYATELQSHAGAPSKDDLQTLRMDIYLCFDYARIQFEAFQCIIKKWDKHMRLTNSKSDLNSESYLAFLGTQRFMDKSVLDLSLRIAQELMMRQAAEVVIEPSDSLDYSSEEYDKRIVVVSLFLHCIVFEIIPLMSHCLLLVYVG